MSREINHRIFFFKGLAVQHNHEIISLLTFVYVRRQTSHKHLTREALDAFPVLVRVTVGRAKDSWDTLVAMAIIKEIVINREERGAAWWAKKGRQGYSKCQACY